MNKINTFVKGFKAEANEPLPFHCFPVVKTSICSFQRSIPPRQCCYWYLDLGLSCLQNVRLECSSQVTLSQAVVIVAQMNATK